MPERRGSVGNGVALRRDALNSILVEHGGSKQQPEGYARLVRPTKPLPGTCAGLSVYRVRGARR